MTVRPWPKTLHGPPPADGVPPLACFYYLGLKKKQVRSPIRHSHIGLASRCAPSSRNSNRGLACTPVISTFMNVVHRKTNANVLKNCIVLLAHQSRTGYCARQLAMH